MIYAMSSACNARILMDGMVCDCVVNKYCQYCGHWYEHNGCVGFQVFVPCIACECDRVL